MSQNGFAPILLIVGLFIAIAVGGGGFYLGQNFKKETGDSVAQQMISPSPSTAGSPEAATPKPSPSPIPSIQTLPSPLQTPVPAAPQPSISAINSNIKSYTSTTYGYSLTYPSNWYLARKTDDLGSAYVHITGPNNGFSVPELYISVESPYSTSGALCANTSCVESGNINLKIKDKDYATPLIKMDNSITRFHIDLPGRMFNVKAYHTGIFLGLYASYQTEVEGKIISDIISSINY